MSINCSVGSTNIPFDLWRPGAILNGNLIAIDTETDLIVDGQVPNLVLASATDGVQGFFIASQHLEAFFAAHRNKTFVLHNAAFDLAVLEKLGVGLAQLVDAGRIFDTALLYRLLKLADTGSCHGRWSLDFVVDELVQIKLPKDVRAADGADVRTTFGRFLKTDGSPDYRELLKSEHRPYFFYAGGDPVATLMLALELNRWAQRVFGNAALNIFDTNTYDVAGTQDCVDMSAAWKLNGFLTHHIQLKASIALAAIERNGMHLDTNKVQDFVGELEVKIEEAQKRLREFDWSPGPGSQTAFDRIMADVEKALQEKFPRTASWKYSRCGDDLEEYRRRSKFINAYLTYQELTKTRNTFLAPLEKGGVIVRGRFNTMVNTGRTSCSGSRDEDDCSTGLNLQNLPREGGVRECLCASPGYVLFACDYAAIELATLSQHCLARFGFSKMAEAIKRGADLHALDAAFRAGLDINTLPAFDKKSILKLLGPDADKLRDKSKAKNFGLPGGLGVKTFVEYARTAYGVHITEEQAKEEKAQWLRMWPEMELHLGSNEMEVFASSFPEAWQAHPKVGSHTKFDGLPWPIHIFKGIICGDVKTKTSGRCYEQDEIDWAWTVAAQVAANAPALPQKKRIVAETRIRERIAGTDLWNMIAPRQRFVATLTGRLRGHPRYCAARNTPFQGLAADGAKRALYRLVREGFRVVNFIHDEVLIEFPIGADHDALAKRVKKIMVEEMRAVVPDVPVDCEYTLMRRWYKGAKAIVIDGKIVPVKPVKTDGRVEWVHDQQ